MIRLGSITIEISCNQESRAPRQVLLTATGVEPITHGIKKSVALPIELRRRNGTPAGNRTLLTWLKTKHPNQ